MLKFGRVVEVDVSKAMAKVIFEDLNVKSGWVFVLQMRSGTDKVYSMPDIGERVACHMDENFEYGVLLGAIYSEKDSLPAGSGSGKTVIVLQDCKVEISGNCNMTVAGSGTVQGLRCQFSGLPLHNFG